MGLIDSLSTDTRQRLEAIATEKRCQLRFKAFECLPAKVLAADLEAKIYTPEEIPDVNPNQVAVLLDSDQWSAGVIHKNPVWIVHNPRHAPTRQESNLMHEIAHILLKHRMISLDPQTGLFKRRQQDEDEAVYLGGCLQIPRRGLLWAIQRKMTLSQIATHFGASEEMVEFRTNVTGIKTTTVLYHS